MSLYGLILKSETERDCDHRGSSHIDTWLMGAVNRSTPQTTDSLEQMSSNTHNIHVYLLCNCFEGRARFSALPILLSGPRLN